MPSVSLLAWQNERLARLRRVEAQCLALLGPTLVIPAPGSPPSATPLPSLAEESVQGFILLLSGHFQGFCRDLYTECTQLCVAEVPPNLQTAVQEQFAAEVKLNSMNPTVETIRRDFERFGLTLGLRAHDPANDLRMTHLDHLNAWRNAVAHQSSKPIKRSLSSSISLPEIQAWMISCDGLAQSVDDILRMEMSRILGRSPW